MPAGSAPSLGKVSRRTGLAMAGCSCAGGALFAYVSFLGLTQSGGAGGSGAGAAQGSGPFGVRLVEALAFWAATVTVGAVLAHRSDKRIATWYDKLLAGLPAAEVPKAVRRQVLNRPVALAALSFGFWVLAGVVFGLVYQGSVSVALVITGVAGVLSTGLALPLADLSWRPIVPVFFPEGRPSEAGAFRLSVFSRLLVSLLLVGLYPTGLLAVTSLGGATALAGAADPQRVIDGLIALEGVLVAVSIAMAVAMALSVTRSVVRPLNELQAGMDRVAQGDLTIRAPVTTTDELGHLGERFNDMVAGLREGEIARGLLDLYVSPEVARQAVESGAELGGRLVHCTVLFADLRDFTALSEGLDPEGLIDLLNRFMTAMVGPLVAERGLVHKFAGDSLLGVFGAPLNPVDEHAACAVRAALGMRQALAELNREAAEGRHPALRAGIGVATGPVVAGNIGGRERIEYTVIGQAVNLASRLQAMTREVDADILLHDGTYAAAAQTMRIDARPLQPLTIRGLSEPVVAYAL